MPKSQKKEIFFYLLSIDLFVFLLLYILQEGQQLENKATLENINSTKEEPPSFSQEFLHHLQHPLAILLLQILCVLISAQVFSWLMIKIIFLKL